MKKQRARALVITPLGNAILQRVLRGTYRFAPSTNSLRRWQKYRAEKLGKNRENHNRTQ